MNRTLIFPVIIIGLSVCAGIVYLVCGDYKRGFYWLFAAGVSICATI